MVATFRRQRDDRATLGGHVRTSEPSHCFPSWTSPFAHHLSRRAAFAGRHTITARARATGSRLAWVIRLCPDSFQGEFKVFAPVAVAEEVPRRRPGRWRRRAQERAVEARDRN